MTRTNQDSDHQQRTEDFPNRRLQASTTYLCFLMKSLVLFLICLLLFVYNLTISLSFLHDCSVPQTVRNHYGVAIGEARRCASICEDGAGCVILCNQHIFFFSLFRSHQSSCRIFWLKQITALELFKKTLGVYSFITQDDILSKISLMSAILIRISKLTRERANLFEDQELLCRLGRAQARLEHH